MALEDYNAHHSYQESPTAELSFDELAKGVASGTLSRGKALRLLGAALVGGAMASIPGVAWAARAAIASASDAARKRTVLDESGVSA
jgi:hypothetical protein